MAKQESTKPAATAPGKVSEKPQVEVSEQPPQDKVSEKPKTEEKRPQLTYLELYNQERRSAGKRWAESRKKRMDSACLRRQYALFHWNNPKLDTPINLGEWSSKDGRTLKPWRWAFVCEQEVKVMKSLQHRGLAGVVVLPEGVEPSKVPVEK